MRAGVIVDNELNDDKRVLREIEILKNAGYEIYVLCFGFGNKTCNSIEGLDISRIRMSKKIKDILFFFLNTLPVYEWMWASRIRRFILGNNIEIIHAHDLYMSAATRSGIRKSGRKIPMILDLHENYPFAVTTYNWTKGVLRNIISRPRRWIKKEKEYLGYADRFIVLSEDFRDVLTGRYTEFSNDMFTVLPNVPDLSQQKSGKDVEVKVRFDERLTILFYFGVVAERRGVFDVLDVLTQLVKEDFPVAFLVIGPVDKKDRERFFSSMNSESLNGRVSYIPWIDLTELPAYLEICDICIAPFRKNPQHESGVANKIYDYMLGRKPVIASDCRPQKRLIEMYSCGITYSNPEELKAAIIKLSGDADLCRLMGENGYRAIVEKFNTKVIKDNLLKLYSEYR